MKKTILAAAMLSILTASCKDTWDEDDKKSFYQACTEDADKWTASPAQTKEYCDCVFQKMLQKYPHEQDALDHIDSLAKDPDLLKCKQDVMKK